MTYGSVCSGIEAASVAWHPLGWGAAFFSEIAEFPRAVLTHHYPEVPLRGDFTEVKAGDHAAIDLLVGGTPCQPFSVAGLRAGLDDDRGQLALEYLRLVDRLRPRWTVWENVPGVLSSDGGRAFGAFLGGLAELGYGWAYRVLDAQYFGVPQRRRRVFVVGHSGANWQRASAVLFEREGLRGDPPPSGEAAKDPGRAVTPSADQRDGLAAALMARASGWDDHQTFALDMRAARVGPPSPLANTLVAKHTGFYEHQTYAFDAYNHAMGDTMATLSTSPKHQTNLVGGERIRRLTPCECERLQGFPDGYTAIPGAVEGHRYRALGNSMAVPVMRWLGRRIALVDDIS